MRNVWKISTLLLSVMLLLVTAGCGNSSAPSAKMIALEDASVREAVLVADPLAAVEDIYLSLAGWEENRIAAARMSAGELEQIVGVKRDALAEYHAYRSDAMNGLADVILLKPVDSSAREEIRSGLLNYRDSRISEFQNYDILNAFEIAQNATVYDQGDYVILLMLADNGSGQDIIDQYIPQ